MNKITVKEHKPLDKKALGEKAYAECVDFAKQGRLAEDDNASALFQWSGKGLHVKNYVGVLTLQNANIEILPKMHLAEKDDEERQRDVFYDMLKEWPPFKQLAGANIKRLPKTDMLELFVLLFLRQTEGLVKAGIVSRYTERTENLTRLKGRLRFPQQAVINAANRVRFFVRYGELSQNHAANRLIRAALERLRGFCEREETRRLQRVLTMRFDAAPPSQNIAKDWQKVPPPNRSMRHYSPVLAWVDLFLQKQGLATSAENYRNRSLLFPMEKVYESYVTAHIRRQAAKKGWTSHAQKGRRWMDPGWFGLKPDIVIKDKQNAVVLDAKWKQVDESKLAKSVSQGDIYQMFAYAKAWGCSKVALVYPKSENFTESKTLTYIKGGAGENIKLILCPFAVDKPKESAAEILTALTH